MTEAGWVRSAGGRHHGAHGESAARSLGLAPRSFLDFSQNINPLGPPPGALEAARAAISGSSVYPDPQYPELRRALGGYLGVPEANVLPTNGGAEALFLAALGLRRAGKSRALILEPTFSEYAAAANAAGMEVAHRPAWRESGGGFAFDLRSLDGLGAGDAVFLCNPNNPTGSALPRDEVREIHEAVAGPGAALVVDEAFADFAPALSVASEANAALTVVRSFTKFFAIPGLRLGCLVSSEAERFATLQPSWPVNAAAAAAGVAAASDAEFAGRSVRRVGELRREMAGELSELQGITVYDSAANFLLLRGPGEVAEPLARRGVLVRGCEPFEGLGPEHFRVAVREREDNRRLVRALREIL